MLATSCEYMINAINHCGADTLLEILEQVMQANKKDLFDDSLHNLNQCVLMNNVKMIFSSALSNQYRMALWNFSSTS